MASGTVRALCALAVLLPLAGMGTVAVHSRGPSARDIAERAAQYVRGYDRRLLELVGEERYEQSSHERRGGRPGTVVVRRTRSTLGWVHLPGLSDTVAVRDVLEVDGRIVQHASRLQRLLQAPGAGLEANVRTLLDEGAAYNLSPGSRNINFPTFPLVYLRHAGRERIRWKSGGRDGPRVIVSFEERGRPTIVRSDIGNLPGRGRFWVHEATGRVERAECRIRRGEMSYELNVTFSPDDRLGIWLPDRMEDVYEQSTTDRYVRVGGEATYSEYRRFETAGRVLPAAP